MNAQLQLKQAQALFGMPSEQQDGVPGPVTTAAFEAFCARAGQERAQSKADAALHEDSDSHNVKASSFADPADVRGFRRCKTQGHSDSYCFGFGDNGIGFTGRDCTDESVPYVALPPEDWAPKWGSAGNATGKKVLVSIGNKTVECVIGDTMPHRANIHNGAGIDLAPGAQKAFGLTAPFMVEAEWRWA